MEYYAIEGTWWKPSSPDYRVPGTLAFDADGLNLTAYGSLVPTIEAPGEVLVQGPPDWAIDSFILGRARDGRRITLLEVGGANLIGPSVSRSNFRARMALVGVHVTADSFVEAWCKFDCLTVWAEPPPLAKDSKDGEQFDLRFGDLDLGQATVGNAHVRLISNVMGEINSNNIEVKQDAAFVIRMEPASARSILDEWIRPIQDLLQLALGRPVRLTAFYLRPEGVERDAFATASFEAVQPAPGPIPDWSTVMSYTAPTLLTFRDSPIPFHELVPAWFRLRSKLSEVFTLLHSPYYAPFMFSEHRYSSLFQSAEALVHAHGLSGREKTPADHKARVAAIILAAKAAGVVDDVTAWAQRILQSGNYKPLARQIEDLVKSTGKIGMAVLDASPSFGQIVSSGRTGVSHGGASSQLDPVGREWHGDMLRWIVRARVLMDLGMESIDVERRVLQRAGFQHTLIQIRNMHRK
jgi:hypothetical protein